MQLPTLGAMLAGSLLMVGPAIAQSPDTTATRADHQTHAAPEAGSLPSGWSARPDDGGDRQKIKFVVMEPGYHLTLGPATILYRPGDRVTGPFHTLATFHQMKKLKHSEGYGIFVGGQALSGKDQRYTYFLVRDDGTYLIKRRKGDKAVEVTKGWTSHPAIKKGDAQGKTANLLEIDAKRDPTRISFLVNGKEVHWVAANRMDTKGVIGIRANHNLDLHVEGFAVHR